MREDSKGTVEGKNYGYLVIGFILLNIMQPLLGITDIFIGTRFVQGDIRETIKISGIAFTVLYWILGSVKNVTIIYGANLWVKDDKQGSIGVLIRSLLIAVILGSVVILLKKPLWFIFMRMLPSEQTLEQEVLRYFSIIILGVPFVLASYVAGGLALACIKEKNVIIIHFVGQFVNIGLNIGLAQKIEDPIKGLALGTLYTQILVCGLSVGYVLLKQKALLKMIHKETLWKIQELSSKLKMCGNILIRIGCVLITNYLIVSVIKNTHAGLCGANLVLLQIKCIMDYVYEGITNATGVCVARNRDLKQIQILKDIHRMTLKAVMGLSILMVVFYSLLRNGVTDFFSGTEKIKSVAQRYDGWLLIYLMIAGWGISGHGLFLGCLETEFVGKSNVIALVLCLGAAIAAVPILGNHGLWMTLIAFYMIRSLLLLGYEDDLYTRFKQWEIDDKDNVD